MNASLRNFAGYPRTAGKAIVLLGWSFLVRTHRSRQFLPLVFLLSANKREINAECDREFDLYKTATKVYTGLRVRLRLPEAGSKARP